MCYLVSGLYVLLLCLVILIFARLKIHKLLQYTRGAFVISFALQVKSELKLFRRKMLI
jgi:hypothetical protein